MELERTVLKHLPSVAEAAAIAIPTPGGGPEQLVMFVVLQASSSQQASTSQPQQGEQDALQTKLRAQCQNAIKEHLNPLFKLHTVVLTASLPRTASNKVMRRVLRDGLLGRPAKL